MTRPLSRYISYFEIIIAIIKKLRPFLFEGGLNAQNAQRSETLKNVHEDKNSQIRSFLS
jgi:hypothetical protein